LHAVLVNVVYPSYQATELFGRRGEKGFSSTDRRSGAFEKSLLVSLFFSLSRRFA